MFLTIAAKQMLAEDSIYIKVHFLYGSKPKREFKDVESKWFGGKLGGHVGIEIDSNEIIDFVPSGDFHYFAKKNDCNSRFAQHSLESFYEIFGGNSDEVKKMSVKIPISAQQKLKLDSIVNAYTNVTPYDYAFIGMRCGAATYDILSQLGVVKQYSQQRTYMKIFYPKKLRKPLAEKARQNSWPIEQQEGTTNRKWEKD